MSHRMFHPKAMPYARKDPVWKWGEAFHDGKLYCFSPRRLLVASPWPDLRAWVKTPCRPWQHTCRAADLEIMPNLALVGMEPRCLTTKTTGGSGGFEAWLDYIEKRRRGAFTAFFMTIPEEAREEALKFQERRWFLLNLFARCPGGLDLSRANPALAMALACNRAFHHPLVQRPYRSARSLLPRSQREILDWLGFPATEPVRRILRKIFPGALTVRALRGLRPRLSEPGFVKLLAHLPTIHAGHLHILLHPRYQALATTAFLHDLSRHASDQDWAALLARPLWEVEDLCRLAGRSPAVPRLQDLSRLYDYHQELLMPRLGSLNPWSFQPIFPDPPFPGIPGIEPISRIQDLFREGEEMGHCVASHLARLHAGLEAVYRVLEPRRATLSLVRLAGRWLPGQIAGPGNAPIPDTVTRDLFRRLLGKSCPPRAEEAWPA